MRNAENKKRCLEKIFIDDLLSGSLKDLLVIIKTDPTLQLCFRGQYASVYYKGDSLFKIVPGHKFYKIHFDFNHSRYTSNFEELKGGLEKLGYKYSQGKGDDKKRSRKIDCKYPPERTNSDLATFWSESIKILKLLIEDFLDLNKKQDFLKKEPKKGKSCHLERQRQQEIMHGNNSLGEGYFIYDIEYDQPRNSNEEPKSGRFDMLALRRVSKGCYNLVFVELKSTTSACEGGSGIEKHYSDLKKYTGNNDIVNIRKTDAVEICKQYGLLGLVEQESIQVKDVEILFIFTDEAVNYANKIKNKEEKCILSSEDLKLMHSKETP